MPSCQIRTRDHAIIVTLPSSVDHVVSMDLEKELREYVARQPKALLCDLSATKYVSSSGIRVFFAIAKMAKTSQVHFGVFSLTAFADHIFRVTGFDRVIAIYDSEDAAIKAVGRLLS